MVALEAAGGVADECPDRYHVAEVLARGIGAALGQTQPVPALSYPATALLGTLIVALGCLRSRNGA